MSCIMKFSSACLGFTDEWHHYNEYILAAHAEGHLEKPRAPYLHSQRLPYSLQKTLFTLE